jgi:glycosyltransferase involved in cell wall biosynthesis
VSVTYGVASPRRQGGYGRVGRFSASVLRRLERRGLVTWEQRDDDAMLLMITNVWPHAERPAYGPFVKVTVDGVRAQGVACDVLFIRGYRGAVAYLAGAIACFAVTLAEPRRYRLAHCHGGETALVARFFWGAPLVASYLGTDLLGVQIGGDLRTRTMYWLRSTLIRRHASLMAATTTKSTEMESLLGARARTRNTVIPDGVDRERFRPRDRSSACARVGWDARVRNVLFAGRVDAVEKRLWLAREAIALAEAELPGIELRIISGVAPSEMPFYYAACDCLLHTSVSEGSPNIVKEALACDVPVIATPAGDVRELLDGVRHCAVCDPDAASLSRALLEALARTHNCDGRERTRHLCREEIARRTLGFYRRCGLPVEPRSRSALVASTGPAALNVRLVCSPSSAALRANERGGR